MKARIKEVNIGYIEIKISLRKLWVKMRPGGIESDYCKSQQQHPGERMEAYIESIERELTEMNIALKENISRIGRWPF